MKLIVLICSLFMVITSCRAQTDSSDRLQTDSNPGVFTKFEIESEFPGGFDGWSDFVVRNFKIPEEAKTIEGKIVFLIFIDKKGSVSNVQFISGPKEFYPAVNELMKKSPRWNPAIQNNRKVESTRKQTIVVVPNGRVYARFL